MSSTFPKKARDQIPYCEDQGMPYLAGAGAAGVSVQHKPNWVMPAGGVFVFANEGLVPMADTAYSVVFQTQNGIAAVGNYPKAVLANKTGTQFTVTGPSTSDVIDVVIVGKLQGQVS